MNSIYVVCLLIASIASIHETFGLQLSMVASRTPLKNSRGKTLQQKIPFSSGTATTNRVPSSSSSSVTSTLISTLACMALKKRLVDQTHVSCDLTAESNNLLFGRVGPVTVRGRGWQSPLGLTCRAIEATVNECTLDMGRVVTNQKLVLTTPAEGQAMVALSATDFGNFITHPLMKPPSPPVNSDRSNSRLVFQKENVSINPSTGLIIFYGTYAGSEWKFELQRNTRGAEKAKIDATLVESRGTDERDVDVDAMEKSLALTTSKFFNDMVFELDGTFLSFEDMMLTDKGRESSVMLSLRIKVKKFPSPGLEF
ncbi:unnamed protein product [Pseudo-nitzschia multistriata]|uniref:NADH:ubiquinone oxidoreductase intermediate-associated protein 30 domain-containing protein n=1 Tax=Pseudo-nitzschia multistriata TaxID=183589 RepID=A0A448Z6R5_9STRA|nr:unnamed protein product [Pseudo-nitzschia multistriata]